ncbi:hypothetical protein PPTG_14830 [Phytophthora nicotianae INRA-310]|uniref:Uncharacterized protein n=1 Tax=Phytophthora nicotianae (strain INRA-310) TaxID=761204 RepID=W2PW44_PHYN3|nr:hypothetical protein PPTG_14830 [Phytophthora nicotianae INRA-310]ETN05188.1 hypothetical protein PPTG_14830 [Phytophthora nicotianae INRA-310]
MRLAAQHMRKSHPTDLAAMLASPEPEPEERPMKRIKVAKPLPNKQKDVETTEAKLAALHEMFVELMHAQTKTAVKTCGVNAKDAESAVTAKTCLWNCCVGVEGCCH